MVRSAALRCLEVLPKGAGRRPPHLTTCYRFTSSLPYYQSFFEWIVCLQAGANGPLCGRTKFDRATHHGR
eukprot:7429827-Pyramimonas_sp.AAC.3